MATRQVVTARQRQVLRLASYGLGNTQIADRLGISPMTVKRHMRDAFKRLEARDRANAVCLCYERGIFTIGGVQ